MSNQPKQQTLKVSTITLRPASTAYFDVDETLILSEKPDNYKEEEGLVLTRNGVTVKIWPHKKHIEKLMWHKFWGDGVVVWSASGAEFAEYICKVLNIYEHVDIILSKPRFSYDDKQPIEYIREVRYLKP